MSEQLPHVIIATELGNIELEVDTHNAPNTAANFLRYVEGGYYDEGSFYRTVKPDNQPDNPVKIEVIQGGMGWNTTQPKLPPIALERTTVTNLSHKDGTVSMSRLAPDSATSEIFICIGDQPELDFGGKRNPDGQGFGAFGRVVTGMEVVRQIQLGTAEGQNLTPPIKITIVKTRL